jgi:hypothetical protein
LKFLYGQADALVHIRGLPLENMGILPVFPFAAGRGRARMAALLYQLTFSRCAHKIGVMGEIDFSGFPPSGVRDSVSSGQGSWRGLECEILRLANQRARLNPKGRR